MKTQNSRGLYLTNEEIGITKWFAYIRPSRKDSKTKIMVPIGTESSSFTTNAIKFGIEIKYLRRRFSWGKCYSVWQLTKNWKIKEI